ncbi:MAG: hypothetical protein RLZZ352_609 [Pseudomonadota bacterium]|jgi:type IV pilus assembly protein PilW
MRWNHRQTPLRYSQGYSIIEVMVGLVIGMIGVAIILQTLLFSEQQKAVTSGAGDTQTNGALAIYGLQRDIRQAGHGFNALNALGCSLAIPTGHTLSQLGSVIINPPTTDVPAGDANTDTLLISYGDGNGPTEGDLILAVNDNNVAVSSVANYAVAENVFAAPLVGSTNCALTLTTVSAISAPNVTLTSATGAIDGGSLFNLGTAPKIYAYAIRNGNLTLCNFMESDCSSACETGNRNCNNNWVAVSSNIISLRAQYGRDTTEPGDGAIDTWDQTIPSSTTAFNRACEWTRIPAVRLVIVARSPNQDASAATAATAPTWDGNADAPITLPVGWQNFRHRAFETIIPLRNMPWMQNC